jgi:hypothetical protein
MDEWTVDIPLSKLGQCGITFDLTSVNDQQKIGFHLHIFVKDTFQFGYNPSDWEVRNVDESVFVEVIIENKVLGNLPFTVHAPPEVLNAIVREEWDPFVSLYHINVVKVIQGHFVFTAAKLTAPNGITATLVKDPFGDGSTDIVDVTTTPPCNLPGKYRIDYEIDCKPGMVCRANTWQDYYIEFEVPDENLCSSVSITERPTMELKMCVDGEACTQTTSDHILGYPILVKAILTGPTTINTIDFYSVSFVNSAGVKKIAKNGFMQTPFGTFLDFTDHYPRKSDFATFEFTTFPDPDGMYDFWKTPDIHTPAQYTIEVTARANYALPSRRSTRLHSSINVMADAPGNFGTDNSPFALTMPPEEAAEEGTGSTVVVVVAVVAVVVVVAVAAVFFHLRRRAQSNEQKITELHSTAV